MDFEGKVAIVTGSGSPHGIGREITRALTEKGCNVVVADMNLEGAQKNADDLNTEFGCDSMAVSVNVTDADSVTAMFEAVFAKYGRIDVLCNNAGITQPVAIADMTKDDFMRIMNVNLVGTFLMTQAVGARMVAANKGGSIINIGSIYGMVSPIQDIYKYKEERTGIPFIKPVAYSAAKSGIYNLTRYCATYWGKKGIRVNTLTPAGVWRDTQDETFIANFTARMPMGRMSHEDEYNGAVIFLASDASSFMTGSNLVIDGGWTAW